MRKLIEEFLVDSMFIVNAAVEFADASINWVYQLGVKVIQTFSDPFNKLILVMMIVLLLAFFS